MSLAATYNAAADRLSAAFAIRTALLEEAVKQLGDPTVRKDELVQAVRAATLEPTKENLGSLERALKQHKPSKEKLQSLLRQVLILIMTEKEGVGQ